MTKKRMALKIIHEHIDSVECSIVRTYGLPHGVGYDLRIFMNRVDSKKVPFILEAHASKDSWELVGHLRPTNDTYEYTGKNDIYREDIIEHWTGEMKYDTIFYHFMRYKRNELEDLLAELILNNKER